MNKTILEIIEQDNEMRHGNQQHEINLGHGRNRQHQLRNFIAWDGEGIQVGPGIAQPYVLFGNSRGMRIVGPSLSSMDCFDLLLEAKAKYPLDIHVGFAINYDINMMLCDLPERYLRRIHATNKVTWMGYRIHWFPGKWLYIRRLSDGLSITLFDIFGFFQSSFILACERFLGASHPSLVRVRDGKAKRETFTYEELEDLIIPYWQTELELIVQLMDSLRSDLEDCGFQLSSWHGPGAVASKVFSIHHIKDHMDKEIDKRVIEAAQYAYAGGRFEQFRCGHLPGVVYEYDINSAYPSAIVNLPSLRQGTWEHVKTFEPNTFGVWHISYHQTGNDRSQPQPLFCRARNGTISYPGKCEGWYWTPEAALVDLSYIIEGWVFRESGIRPFEFVNEYYERRREWKQNGISAEKALKLALNSMYGKMAQRIGGYYKDGKIQVPTWHQLEWAGYVTSYTRASLMIALFLKPDSVVALETDALFTTEPLPLRLGGGLGEWELTTFDNITYIQSGFYYAEQGDKRICKYRGLDKDRETGEPKNLPYRKVLDYLSHMGRFGGRMPPLYGHTSRFNGLGISLSTHAVWRAWDTGERKIDYGGSGKRAHITELYDWETDSYTNPCPECVVGLSHAESLHHCTITTEGGLSHKHSLPWVDQAETAEDLPWQWKVDAEDRWQPQRPG